MFIKPAYKNFPKFIQENLDQGWIALSNAIDNLYNYVKTYQDRYKNINDIGRAPSLFLNELGYFLEAGIVNNDTEQQKRQKILNAIESHIKRGVFQFDTKPRLDTITGYNSKIFRYPNSDDAIWLGSSNDVNSDKNWMTWNGWGANSQLLGLVSPFAPGDFFVTDFDASIFSVGSPVFLKKDTVMPSPFIENKTYYVMFTNPYVNIQIHLCETQQDAIDGNFIPIDTPGTGFPSIYFKNSPTPELGIWWIRLQTVVSGVIAGVISINLHEGINEPILSQDVINKCVEELTADIAPAYMQVQLGYVDESGFFRTYNEGVI